jgi:hypothetical protein
MLESITDYQDEVLALPTVDHNGHINLYYLHRFNLLWGNPKERSEALQALHKDEVKRFLALSEPPEPFHLKKAKKGQRKMRVVVNGKSRKISMSPMPKKANKTKNFQGYQMKDCHYETDLGLHCFVPPNYDYDDVPISHPLMYVCCKHCYLKPCMMVARNLVIRKKETYAGMCFEIEQVGIDVSDHASFQVRKSTHIRDFMKDIVLPAMVSKIFSKKYFRNMGLPFCATKYLRSVKKGNLLPKLDVVEGKEKSFWEDGKTKYLSLQYFQKLNHLLEDSDDDCEMDNVTKQSVVSHAVEGLVVQHDQKMNAARNDSENLYDSDDCSQENEF